MDGFSHLTPDERTAMECLRARLRARAEDVVALVEAVVDEVKAAGTPLTVDDGWRCARLMRQADAMVCQLYATPESVIRPPAAPKPARKADNEEAGEEEVGDDDISEDEIARRGRNVIFSIIATGCRIAGFWPNGEPAAEGQPFDAENDEHLARLDVTAVFSTPGPTHENTPDGRLLALRKIVEAINAGVQHAARQSGVWPDGSRFEPEAPDPGYYSVPTNWEQRGRPLCAGESRTAGLPWSVVRKTSPPG